MSARTTRVATVLVLLGLLFAVTGCMESGTPEPSPNDISGFELIETPKKFDGEEITFTGEVIGESMARGDMAWLHINDDAYYVKNVEEGAQLGGQNSGAAIWVPLDQAEKVTYFGDHKHQGDIVTVVGIFDDACAEHGGDMDIHAASLEVIEAGHRVIDPINPSKVVWAVVLGSLALALYLLDRYWLRGSEHGSG